MSSQEFARWLALERCAEIISVREQLTGIGCATMDLRSNEQSRYRWRIATRLANCAFLLIVAIAFSSCDRAEKTSVAENSFPVLTPPEATSPRINGPKIFGVRPGAPFLFRIIASGERPMEFSAANLPSGLQLNSANGQIAGVLNQQGRYSVIVRARNRAGIAERELKIVVGDEIALTPPMGWNSFNAWGNRVTQAQVLAAARGLVATGLRDHGWIYVNVDDGWQGERGGSFKAIQPNNKFPDMQNLSDQIHSLGLKFGIYSTPARTTFGWHIGSSADRPDGTYDWITAKAHDEVYKYLLPEFPSFFDHFAWLKPLADHSKKRSRSIFTKGRRTFGYPFIEQDVRQWNAWDVDYLKYDWLPVDIPHAAAMSEQLRKSGRDIVYSVSNNADIRLAPELSRIANSWRTTVDITDSWKSVSAIGFSQDKWARFNGPGHYNDPDMLVLGHVLWSQPERSRLTSDEQYTHMSLWCLLSGPLLLGADLDKLDPFTRGLLTNDEVLDIDQDVLCKQAICVARNGDANIYAKPLEDGSLAVGLFNRGSKTASVRARWSDLGISGTQLVRDLWRQKDLGQFDRQFEAQVASHGVVLIRVIPAK